MIDHFALDPSLKFCHHIFSCPIGRVVKGMCFIMPEVPGSLPGRGKETVLCFEHRGLFVGILTSKMQNLLEIEKKIKLLIMMKLQQ